MRRSILALLLGFAMVAGQSFAAPTVGNASVSEVQEISGILSVQYGDYVPGSGTPSRRLVTLHADSGEVFLLEADGAAPFLARGAHVYQGKRVTVTGRMKYGPGKAQSASALRQFVVTSEVQVRDVGATGLAVQKYSDPTPVARPFLSLLCKFADVPDEPEPVAYFNTMHNNTYPGFDHYMREASYGKITLVGSNAFGWFTLPQPRSFYVPTNPTNEQSQQMLTNLAEACTEVARATVNFTPYFGINFMFNGALDGAAWGGTSVLNLTAEGTKSWPSTWMPYLGSGADRFGWNTHNIMAHELSHAFGAPHSQTPEGNEYGSSWDVVSAPGDNCTAAFTDAAYGCIGQSMNAYAKLTMDFLPDNRVAAYVLGSGSQTYQLERLAQAPASTNPVMVRIPIAGSTTRFYTVEARTRLGYDQKLRTDGVIIHEIDTTRDRQAQVVPMDSGDAGSVGAAWAVGSAFLSSSENIMIQVVAATPTGFTVSVGPVPAGTISLAVSRTGSGAGSVSSSPAGIDCGTTCNSGFNTATVVTLTATASTGSTFRGWSGICSGTSTCTVTLDAAKRVTATFSALDAVSSNLAVYLAGTGTGTVTSNPFGINCGPVCSWDSDPSSASVTLVATPASGSVFAGWSGACMGTNNCTVTAAESRSLTVTFDLATNIQRLGNISTRMQVLTGNDVMIGGFVIGGSANKTVVVRARGPSLVPFGITNALANPQLQLVRSSDQVVIATNDDWQSAGNAASVTASGFAPGNALEAAILVSLPPGAYTAIVSGVGNGTGVGIVEVFEVDAPASPLVNISTRGQVLTGNDVMIGGFIVQGSGPQTVVVRARGPSLIPFGITNALANPQLQLVRSSDQVTIATNDDFGTASNLAQLNASGFAPSNALEAAILITLQPGAYTAIVTGAGGGTGVGIVEVFATTP